MTDELERSILRHFFECVSAVKSPDSTISDFKIVKDTQKKLKAALQDAPAKCTCARRTWGGPCEVCQCSGRELYSLRNFFRVIRNAKKHDMTAAEIQEFIENTKKDIGEMAD